MMVERGTFLVSTTTAGRGDGRLARPRRNCRPRPPRCSPKRATSIRAAYEAGVKIAVGTDAPAIPHGKNADELVALVELGPAAVGGAAGGDRPRPPS